MENVIFKDTENYVQWEREGYLDIDNRAYYNNKPICTLTCRHLEKVMPFQERESEKSMIGENINSLAIRRLTPKEAYRLMGFDDIDYENAHQVNSDTQLYKQAGNSIVVNVLEAIFKELFLTEHKENTEPKVKQLGLEIEKKDEENIMPKNEEVKKQDYTNLNVAQKLALARTMWLDANVNKGGVNTNMEYKYFTLKDIEPIKVKIFKELNLVDIYDFGSQVNQAGEPLAILQLYNADNRQEACLKFALPYKNADPIVSRNGKQVNSTLQQLGSSNTYIKRYLLLNLLSIEEVDDTEESLGMEVKEEPKPKVVKKPLNEEEKKEVVNKVVGDEADEMQLQALKKVAKKLNDIGEQELAKKLQLKSNNFTSMSRENCEKCIEVANGIIDKSNTEDGPWNV